MTAAFQKSVALILEQEGGFQAKKSDRGNWTSGVVGKGELKGTKFGISAMTYPNEDIRALTKERAVELYHRDFWLKIRGDELPFPIAAVTFDAAVNSGPVRAIKWLQRALGVTVDGVIGPVTMGAAQSVADPKGIAARACRERLLFLAHARGFASWGPSWVQRTLDAFRLAVEEE